MKEKKWINSNIFYNITYFLEFFISIFGIVEILRLYTTKNYAGYWSKRELLCSAILTIIIIFIIIYHCVYAKKKTERIFLTFAIPIGVAFGILILPLHVPDEGSHFIKAYDMAQGHFFTQLDENGDAYCTFNKYLENYSYNRFNSYQTVFEEIKTETDYKDNIKTISAAQSYSPFMYIGSAIAIKVCEILNQNILIAIYAARLTNYIIFLILGYFSIKKISFGNLVICIYLLMPMMLQQAASCSPDSILNATIIYYVAHIISIIFRNEESISKKDKIILFILTAMIAMFKYVYLIVAGLIFILLWDKRIRKKERILTIATVVLIGTIFALTWIIFSAKYTTTPSVMEQYREEANVNNNEQIQYIINNPFDYLKVMARDYKLNGENYIYMLVGSKLGWLNIQPNHLIITLFIILLLVSTIAEKNEEVFHTKQKIWCIAIIIGVVSLVQLAMYISWTPVGSEIIGGIQGRYFIPVMILALLCLCRKEDYIKLKNPNILLPIYAILLDGLVLNTILRYFI